jgi:hypothetical protein
MIARPLPADEGGRMPRLVVAVLTVLAACLLLAATAGAHPERPSK